MASNADRLKALKKANAIRQWRAQFPWTNGEFIAAIRQDTAAQSRPNQYLIERRAQLIAWIERTSRISGVVVRIALPWLVKTCAICGAPALYRIGIKGRCKAHATAMVGNRPKVLATQRLKGIKSDAIANANDAYLRRAESAKKRSSLRHNRSRH